MGLGIDLSQVDEGNINSLHKGGGNRPSPGRGMVIVTGWQDYGAANGNAHKLSMEIVAWSDESSIAQTTDQSIFHADRKGTGHPQKIMIALGLAGGLFTARDIQMWKAAGQSADIDYCDLIGRPIMVQLVEEPDRVDPGKTWLNVGYYGKGYFHCKHPEVADWPKNQSILNKHAATIGDWVVLGESTPEPPQPVPAASASASANPFGDNA